MSDPVPASPTAAVLVIGDEILSGRTKDGNSGYIADRLTELGIDLREIRVVADDQAAIVEAVNALRARYTYVFTTGGIGPTHDDITADSMAAAFGVGIDFDPRAVALMQSRFPDQELNAGRMRMARIPLGAELIANSVSKAPGFRLENVFVMAGVPAVMHVMLDALEPELARGVPMLSEAVRADAREGDVAEPLADIQRAHPHTAIGSYPFVDEHGYNTSIVVRSRDEAALRAAVDAVRAMLAGLAG